MNRLLHLLLAVVAISAAVLSFDALHGLAVLCGFTPRLAPLLPLTVDAGAAAGSLVWLGRESGPARVFGRRLALLLLGGSVAGNALGHGLAAYAAHPHWVVVVVVSAVPPAVLGAVVHLAVLAGRAPAQALSGRSELAGEEIDEAPEGDRDRYPELASVDDHGLSRRWESAPPAGEPGDRAVELIAEGAGRRRLAKELGIGEHEARQLLARHRDNRVEVRA
ncbi:MAG: DUF2637 domain-containing protein [Pseudonocardia sp.]|nr:DUF2637 domain-containing protein [Pseudonocardia sp.]